jgi:hypothetical protein
MLMRSSLIFVLCLASATTAAAESYNPSYAQLLRDTGLLPEAYHYNLLWAGEGYEEAQIALVDALIEGLGTDPNPRAAVALLCSFDIHEFGKSKLLIRANLRLSTEAGYEPLKCQ